MNSVKDKTNFCTTDLCSYQGSCLYDCDADDGLTALDIKALDEFKDEVLTACNSAAWTLVGALEKIYPNLDVNALLDEVTTLIEDWTEEGILDKDLDDDLNDEYIIM